MSKHTCHWPGCTSDVPPKRWGCQGHWYALPAELRARIWAAYVPGQEITKTPSREYLAVAREAEQYALAWASSEAETPGAPAQACLF